MDGESGQRHYSGELETFKLRYCKFIQDNVYQILSESIGFCGRNDILVCFISVHSVSVVLLAYLLS